MLSGFQQQPPMTNFTIPKSAAAPQHGQRPDELCKQIKERRSFAPRPQR